MLQIVLDLPNKDFVDKPPLSEIIKEVEDGNPMSGGIVSSGLWYDAPSYDHLDQYEAAFHAVAKEVSKLVGEDTSLQLGFDEETFEPTALLKPAEIYCDFFYHWPRAKLLLLHMHEDKELNIDIGLNRFPA